MARNVTAPVVGRDEGSPPDVKVRPPMICAELEDLEAQLDEIITALENPQLKEEEKKALEKEYGRVSHLIDAHQIGGHDGGPCFEE